MVKIPKIKDLKKGFLKCSSCKTKLSMDEYEPLEITECPKCGVPILFPMRIKTYWLFHPLGAGGMGSVYRALDEVSKKECAIKILPRERKDEPELINTLMREAEIGSTFGTHPHLVEVIDYGEEDGEYYMATSFVYGERLDHLLENQEQWVDNNMAEAKGHLSERQAVDITLQIIDAEMHIVECGYLFRDLKPENVIVEENGNVRLFDYGLCMTLEEAADDEVVSETFEGSPFYIPPERIVGAAEGEYSEIYSLGMLMYFMTTGRTYYSEAELKDLVSKHVTSLRLKSVETRLKHCSPEVAEVLDKMIQRMPDDRFPDFELLKAHMEPLLENMDTADDVQLLFQGEQTKKVVEESGRSLALKLVVGVLGLCMIAAAGILPFYYSRWSRMNSLRKEITAKLIIRLEIPADIKDPDLPAEEISQLVKERTEELVKEKTAALSAFDEKKEKTEICKKLNINPNSIMKPEKSFDYYKKNYRKEISKHVMDIIETKGEKFSEEEEKEKIFKQLMLKKPLKKPTLSKEDVEKKLFEGYEKQIATKFSTKALSREIMKLTKKYRESSPGDVVDITDSRGIRVTGKYKGREGNKLVISVRQTPRKILITNIPLRERWRFDKTLSKKKTASEIKKLKKHWKKKQKAFKKKLYTKPRSEFYAKNHYYWSQKDNTWKSARDVIDECIMEAKRKHAEKTVAAAAKVRKKIEKKIDEKTYFRSRHFRYLDKKWRPETEAVQLLLDQKKQAFDKKRATQLKKIEEESLKQAEKEIYPEHNYVLYKNKWQPAKPLLKELVESELEMRMRTLN